MFVCIHQHGGTSTPFHSAVVIVVYTCAFFTAFIVVFVFHCRIIATLTHCLSAKCIFRLPSFTATRRLSKPTLHSSLACMYS